MEPVLLTESLGTLRKGGRLITINARGEALSVGDSWTVGGGEPGEGKLEGG